MLFLSVKQRTVPHKMSSAVRQLIRECLGCWFRIPKALPSAVAALPVPKQGQNYKTWEKCKKCETPLPPSF